MRILFSRLRLSVKTRPQLWIGVPVSLALGLAAYWATAHSIEADARRRFAVHANNARNHLASRIKSYTDVGRGTVALFESNFPLTQIRFHDFVDALKLKENFPAVIAMNFVEYLRPEDVAPYLQRMRTDPLPNGARLTNFAIHPQGQRESYSVATYHYPLDMLAGIGRDLQTRPLVGQLYALMRDEGTLAATGMPIPALSSSGRIGLSFRLPAYRARAPLGTLEQRRQAFLGSVGIGFSVELMVKEVIDAMPLKKPRMTLIDRDLGLDNVRNRVLFDDIKGQEAAHTWLPMASRYFYETVPVDYHGRRWEATFSVEAREIYSPFEAFIAWLALLAGFVSSMLLYALIHAIASSHRRAVVLARGMTGQLRDSQEMLQASHRKLRNLAAHAEQIKEVERKRIAREIHDDLGQNLLALRIDADMLANRTMHGHPRLNERARATRAQIDTTIKSVRQIINDLRPTVLDLGLPAAVEWQIAEFRRRTGIACELVELPGEVALSEQAAVALFRILQESLSNIVRHSGARHVRVALAVCGGELTMSVKDDGIGIDGAGRAKSGSFGLVGIEERIILLGGIFSIEGSVDQGTTVSVSVPLAELDMPTH
jgi:signal transduction histidine kinase